MNPIHLKGRPIVKEQIYKRRLRKLFRKTGKAGKGLLWALICLTLAVIIFFPIGVTLLSALNLKSFVRAFNSAFGGAGRYYFSGSGGQNGLFGWSENMKRVLFNADFLVNFNNSTVTAVAATLIRVTTGTIAAFALAVKDFKGRKIVLLLILGTMMIPQDVLLIPNFVTISKLNLRNTYLGIISVDLVSAIHIFMLYQCFRSLGKPLREAAYIDGCNDFKFMTKICIPCSWPVIAALSIHSFIYVWNDYLWPLLMSDTPETRTLPVALVEGRISPYTMLLTLSLLPPLILFLLFQRTLVRGLNAGSVVG